MKTSANTMDLRIAKAMREAANVVFAAMPKTQDVNITSMQVYQHFTDAKKVFAGLAKDLDWLANIPASEGDGWNINTDHVITISVDSFACKCEGIAIFYYLNTFERIAGVKDRARFTYSMPKTETAKVMTITVDKNAVDILAHATNNELCAVMMSVFVDFRYNNIVSSDGHTMQIMRCNISGNVPNIDGVVIPAHIAKRVLKERVFTLTIDGSHITCGNECFEDLGRYPAYLRVWIGFLNESDQFVKLSKNAWKSVRKQATIAMKNDGKYFVFRALSGEHKITVDVWDSIEVKYKDGRILNTFTFDVENAVPVSFTKAFTIKYVLHFKDVESFQGLDHGRAMCMYGNNFSGLLMPNLIEGLKDDYILFVDDSKQKYFFPVEAYKIERETANTIPVETMEETANTVPVETMEETANTIPVETMEETANTIPVETMEETANTIPVETMEETANTVPVETMEETANTIPVETMEETANTIPVETIAEDANSIPVETIAEDANTIPVETIAEDANTIPVETIAEDSQENAFMAFILTLAAACILAMLVLTGSRPHIELYAANTVPVETIAEDANTIPVETIAEDANTVPVETIAEDANTIPVETIDHINEVICTGSLDPYIEHVKEEITAYYRESRESQLQELAELASVDDTELIAAIETTETDTESEENALTVETIEDTENTAESVEIMPTDTDTETDAGTVSDTDTETDTETESEPEYTTISVTTYTTTGEPVINTYTVLMYE